MPPENIQKSDLSRENNKLLPISVLLVLLLFVLGFFLLKKPSEEKEIKDDGSAPGVEVTRPDLSSATSPDEKLPSGFPEDIPVEKENITQSFSAQYTEHGITQYSVTYSSERQIDEIFEEYESFMKNSGFEFGEDGINRDARVIKGTRGGDDLLVIIGITEGKIFVQISYLKR